MKATIDDLMILICGLEIVTFGIGTGTSSTPLFVRGLKAVMIQSMFDQHKGITLSSHYTFLLLCPIPQAYPYRCGDLKQTSNIGFEFDEYDLDPNSDL